MYLSDKHKRYMRWRYVVALCLIVLVYSTKSYSQCCAAGTGSPIAGDVLQGVLKKNQAEISSNFQYNSSNKFLHGDVPANDFLKKYYSSYNYLRMAYGLTENLTFSVESGYYFTKTQIHLDDRKIFSSGIGDVIILPRYNVINKKGVCPNFSLTLGLGVKIPIGKYNDSIGEVEPFSGNTYYITLPPALQPTSGSNDFIFMLFASRNFSRLRINVFSNGLYVKKGWTPLGEKFGDYASVSLFFNKVLFKNLGTTLQLKGEWIDKMKFNDDAYMMGSLNYDPYATGSKKIIVAPQLSYTIMKKLTIFSFAEFPIYQYVTGTQIASQHMITAGITYRFFAKSNSLNKEISYACPMKCKDSESNSPGKCVVCGMDLEKLK